MELANIIATNIQNLLDENNVSISEISSFLGISRQTMTNYLKTTSVIDSVQLAKIADYFNVSVLDLYNRTVSERKSEMIFRTALNPSTAIEKIQDGIYDYLESYIQMAQSNNKQLCYFPEQYNLSLNSLNKTIDINYECQNYFDPKLKIDRSLDSEILRIANEQRKILCLGDKGAISLISALTKRGINVIFYDLGNDEIFGLSICDETKGCYIFVNSNSKISVERQLFTLAHEYGHILMHRPVFKRKLQYSSEGSTSNSLLDKMADRFAGYLLAPDYMLAPYADQLASIRTDLNAICRLLIPLKLKFQVSLFSLLISFKNFGYISPIVVNEYSRFVKIHNIDKMEINPISEHPELMNTFKREVTYTITEMIHAMYDDEKISISEAKQRLKFFSNYSETEIEKITDGWKNANNFNLNSIL